MEIYMILKYLGKKENFKTGPYDFSKGPCEVPDDTAEKFLQESPRTFKALKAKVQATNPAKPAA